MNARPPLLVVQDLRVGHDQVLLEGVDWTLCQGESWFVLGRNGSGKSSLVATMLGLLRPLGGDMRRAPDLHRRLGYVPQEPRFDPPLPFSVREFVEIGLDRTWRSRPAAAAVDDALLALDLAELARRPVRALSVGQRRRAMIARAMARRPVLLVLDEPTAHLDAHSAHRVVMDLDRLRREHDLCIVHVAHDLALAREYASHVALLHDRRVQTEPAAAIWADPTLQAVFAVGPA